MILLTKLVIVLIYVKTSFGKKSFTILLDTTLSMEDEVEGLKRNIGSVVNYMNTSDIENFILVPFNDPDVEPPIFASNPSELIDALNSVTANGGHDCPENSLTGIKKALDVSNRESQIFVFTDAYAKDSSKLADLQNLCYSTGSQVIIFLTGKCLPSLPTSANADVYYHIAKSCRGVLFRLDLENFKQAFNLMKEITKTDWTEITTQNISSNFKDVRFSVDSSDKEIIIAFYGESLRVQLVNDGREIESDKVIDTANAMVVRLQEPAIGEYRALIRSQGVTSATFYRKQTESFPYLYGFSTRLPNSWMETSLRPLPDCTSYIIVASNGTMEPKSLQLSKVGSNDKTVLQLQQNYNHPQFYYARNMFEHNTSYRITITGQDISNRKTDLQSSIIIETQRPDKNPTQTQPIVEILEMEKSLVNYDESVNLACKVIGYPEPMITWKDDEDNTYSAEDVLLEIPNVRISYANITSLRKNTTFECKAFNALGEHNGITELFVKRNTFLEVKQTPEEFGLLDNNVEYGTEAKLYCEVEAYPEASITWYHNDSVIYPNSNIELQTVDHTLVIKSVTLEDGGEYKCEIKNDVETKIFSAKVEIFGLEAPKLETTSQKVTLKPGDWVDIECFSSGKPKPDITWKHKQEDSDFWSYLPNGIDSEEGKLKIPEFKSEYAGLYRCEAFNIVGQDYKDITVTSQYKPTIKNVQDTLTVKEGDIVELKCEVDAMPTARVRWELTQDDVIVPFENRHVTDGNNTHRFEAFWKDSGNYHCIAENSVGRVEKSIIVNVLVAPYIQTPESNTITAQRGSILSLPCNVLFGNPAPTTKWEFVSLNSTKIVISRGNTSNTLIVRNISKKNEGAYICIADNDVGSDTIKINLKVQ